MRHLNAHHRIIRMVCDNPLPQTFNVESKAHELALRNLRGSRNPSFEHTIANNIELRGRGGRLARSEAVLVDMCLCCELLSVNSPQLNVLSVILWAKAPVGLAA